MSRIDNRTSYMVVFDALIEVGYTEKEAEQLICDIITEQREYDDYADRIHNIVKEVRSPKNRS